MKFLELKDKWMLFKEVVRPRIYQNPLFNRSALVKEVIKSLKLERVKRVFKGNPNTITIITRDSVIRVPIDELSLARCQNNKSALIALQKTSIASFVPKFLGEGKIIKGNCFIESRLPGIAIGIPISNMDYLVEKAVDFITKFHKETAQEVLVDESVFNRLVSCDLVSLCSFLTPEYSVKLKQIESNLKYKLIGKKLKTVWFHGDYKIENILFNSNTWQITGLIDWDLSHKIGLPLLDIIYLLTYNEVILQNNNISDIFRDRYTRQEFTKYEEKIIDYYLDTIGLDNKSISSLIIVFWINHIARRFQSTLISDSSCKKNWLKENVYNLIDLMLETK